MHELAISGGIAELIKAGESANARRAYQWTCQFLSVWLANSKNTFRLDQSVGCALRTSL